MARFCRKCLPEQIQEGAYIDSLRAYVANLDPELKVEDGVYEERLAICSSCKMFTEAMCRACGCFVEMRGAMKKNHCPYDHW